MYEIVHRDALCTLVVLTTANTENFIMINIRT